MTKRTLSIFLLMLAFYSQAQNFIRPNEWKKYRREIYAGVGAANFLGDLGGLDQVGSHYSPVDVEFTETRTAFTLGYRYKLFKWLNVAAEFNYMVVKGDDKLTQEQFRSNRNLNFRSNIFELAGRLEFVYMANQVGHRYGIKRTLTRRMKNRSWDFSFFVGLGGFYFNPEGKNAGGLWQDLKPLHTEGQGLPNGPSQYSNFAVCIPIGLAYRLYFNKIVVVGIEVNFRKTFTDYIDDCSGVYYDKNAIGAAYGGAAAYFADPSLGKNPHQTDPEDPITKAPAQIRGNSRDQDSYMAVMVTVGYIIKSKRGRARLRSKF